MSTLIEQPAVTSSIDSTETGDRRRSTRDATLTPGVVRFVPESNGQGRAVTVYNVSLNGAGFRCDFNLEQSDTFYVQIGAGPLQLTSKARVVRARKTSEGKFDIGCEFC